LSVRVYIPHTMQSFANDQEVLEAEGKNVGECIQNCINVYPQLYNELFKEKGKLNNYIEIYVNQESAYPNELSKPVKDGDEIHISLMLAGG